MNIQGNIGEWYQNQTPEMQYEFIVWLYSELQNREVPLSFYKADGSVRNMTATLKEALIDGDQGISESVMNSTAENHVIVVWDMGVNAWRSFRLDRMITIE